MALVPQNLADVDPIAAHHWLTGDGLQGTEEFGHEHGHDTPDPAEDIPATNGETFRRQDVGRSACCAVDEL